MTAITNGAVPWECCSIGGCFGLRKIRGLCMKHYQRVKRFGDPNATKRVPAAVRRGYAPPSSGGGK